MIVTFIKQTEIWRVFRYFGLTGRSGAVYHQTLQTDWLDDSHDCCFGALCFSLLSTIDCTCLLV